MYKRKKMGIPATDAPVRIHYAHFIKDFTITVTEAEGTTTIYTKDDAILYEEEDYYLVYIMSNSDETFIIEGEGFVPYEGEVSPNIDVYLQPNDLYAYTKEEGIVMYAWTIEDGSEVIPSSCNTIYTTTPVLDLNNGVFYDENGVEYTTSPKVTPDLTLKYSDSSNDFFNTYAIEATAEKITMGATSLD